jgi:hypothetical protein
MRKIHFIISLFVLAIALGCTDDNSSVDLDAVTAPTNISALTTVTQDNTGKVTFLPKGEGVTQYEIYFGDGTSEPAFVNPGETVSHVYKEGVYQSKIVGTTLNGKRTEVIQEVVVSFKSPENLVVVIANDLAVSKKVTVTATADFALFYDVYFGEDGKPDPISVNNGESVSYVYQAAGVYKIRVVSKSAAIKTTEYTEDFTVTMVNKPSASAPTPPNRQAGDVISIYSSKYTDVAGTNFNPNWGQSGTYAEFDLNGDKMLNYIKLSYQGIDIGSSVDASAMETLHIDIWSADNMSIDIYPLPNGVKPADERFVTKALVPNQWNSFDIPLSDFTSQGLPLNDLKQFKFVGNPSGTGTVFIDNIYFYKEATVVSGPTAAPTPTVPAANVISMFSNAYTNVSVDTWRTSWSNATLEDVTLGGNAAKKYSALDFVGIETASSPIDATAMTHFHTDVWSSDFTTFKIKLVDFGANGAFGGGDDKEHEVTFTSPAKDTWVSLDIPLSDFVNLTTRAHISQLIYVGAPTGNNTVYVDNVYFHN